MKITNFNDIKFTSVKHDGSIIHFKYKGEDYTVINGGLDCTLCIRLFKGNTKGKLECISSTYGWIPDLIRYKFNKKVLKYIDKEYFVWKLISNRLLESN